MLVTGSLQVSGECHPFLSKAESPEHILVDRGQQISVSLGQLDFLHREVGVEVSHVGRR